MKLLIVLLSMISLSNFACRERNDLSSVSENPAESLKSITVYAVGGTEQIGKVQALNNGSFEIESELNGRGKYIVNSLIVGYLLFKSKNDGLAKLQDVTKIEQWKQEIKSQATKFTAAFLSYTSTEIRFKATQKASEFEKDMWILLGKVDEAKFYHNLSMTSQDLKVYHFKYDANAVGKNLTNEESAGLFWVFKDPMDVLAFSQTGAKNAVLEKISLNAELRNLAMSVEDPKKPGRVLKIFPWGNLKVSNIPDAFITSK